VLKLKSRKTHAAGEPLGKSATQAAVADSKQEIRTVCKKLVLAMLSDFESEGIPIPLGLRENVFFVADASLALLSMPRGIEHELQSRTFTDGASLIMTRALGITTSYDPDLAAISFKQMLDGLADRKKGQFLLKAWLAVDALLKRAQVRGFDVSSEKYPEQYLVLCEAVRSLLAAVDGQHHPFQDVARTICAKGAGGNA
jgi:hypothetical protein